MSNPFAVPLRRVLPGAVFLVGFAIAACLRFSGATLTAALPQTTTAQPLVQQGDMAYVGAFRVPAKAAGDVDVDSFAYGGTVLTYNPVNDSLYLVGFSQAAKVGELSIPAALVAPAVTDLRRATYLQPLTDILAGRRTTVDGGVANGVYLGGILPFANSLIVSAYTYYDGGGTQSLSHFKTGTNFASVGPVVGPVEVSTALRSPGAGFVAGYMTDVPAAWQSALGCQALTGQGAIAVVSRSSYGPSISCFNPSDIGTVNPAPSTPLVGYPNTHTTLGNYGPNGNTAFFNGNMKLAGAIFPAGTSSVLFFGRRGQQFCYGPGTTDPSLHLQPVPGQAPNVYCYDPTNPNKGTHGYPYEDFVAAYDVHDLIAVKNGQKKPWEIVPYATWTFNLPFEQPSKELIGVTYDPATRRIFVSAGHQDGNYPIIHVFTLNAGVAAAGNHLCYW
jgi:hypothetical protein